MRKRRLASWVALSLAVTGCGPAGGGGGGGGGEGSADGSMRIVVGFYPLQYLAERIGGDAVQVSSLAQPGAEPHDLELAPRQIQDVAEADLLLYLSRFQPAVDDAVAQNAEDSSFDVLTATDLADGFAELGGEETGPDPHVWLDPTKYVDLAGAVAERMGATDPRNADTYTANAETLAGELTGLDRAIATGLADCERNEFVTTHNAFGYLAARYDLQQVAIAGLSPEDEPSPQTLDDVRRYAEDHGVTTIFYEDTVSPEYAETVADQVGADTAVLSPIEVVDDGEDYISVMRDNLAALHEALGCR